MEPEKPSDCDVLVDLTAAKRMFMQLIDVHRFGDWRIFLDGSDGETGPQPSPRSSSPGS